MVQPACNATRARRLKRNGDAGRKAAGIELALVAISQAHKLPGNTSPRLDPVVQDVRQGIRNTIGTAQTGKATPPVDAVPTAVTALPPHPGRHPARPPPASGGW